MWIGEASRCGLQSFAFTPDGATMYTGDDFGCVLAWDRQTHEYQELFELKKYLERQPVRQLVLAPDATRLFIPTTDRIYVLNLPDGKPGKHLRNFSSMLPRVVVAPDGCCIAAVSNYGRVVAWDATTLKRQEVPGSLGKLKGVAHVAFVENETRLLVIRQAGEEVSLWDTKTGEQVRVLSKNEVWCRVCALSADGRVFAACTVDGLEVRVYGLPDWTRRATIRYDRKIESLALNPTGELLAVTDGTKSVALWNTSTGTKVGAWNWRIGEVQGAAFAPDGLTCVVGGVGRFAVFDVDL